jgi:hypothetical protein
MNDYVPVSKKFLKRLIEESSKIEVTTNEHGMEHVKQIYCDAFRNNVCMTIVRFSSIHDIWETKKDTIGNFMELFYEYLLTKYIDKIKLIAPHLLEPTTYVSSPGSYEHE